MRDYSVDEEVVRRAARMYRTNTEAAQALGIVLRSFNRLCRRHRVETPWDRRRRILQDPRREQ